MRVGPVVLKLRLAETRFGDKIGGAAELDLVLRETFNTDMAFVVQLSEEAGVNQDVNSINQILTERFAVIVALKNDTTQSDKTGLTAFDTLHEVRTDIFKALLGWQIEEAESIIRYAAGALLDINDAWLWYQFEFEFDIRLYPEDGVDPLAEEGADNIGWFNTIYTEYILSPDANLPWGGELPVDQDIPDAEQIVDLTDDPRDGAFDDGFAKQFDVEDR